MGSNLFINIKPATDVDEYKFFLYTIGVFRKAVHLRNQNLKL